MNLALLDLLMLDGRDDSSCKRAGRNFASTYPVNGRGSALVNGKRYTEVLTGKLHIIHGSIRDSPWATGVNDCPLEESSYQRNYLRLSRLDKDSDLRVKKISGSFLDRENQIQ